MAGMKFICKQFAKNGLKYSDYDIVKTINKQKQGKGSKYNPNNNKTNRTYTYNNTVFRTIKSLIKYIVDEKSMIEDAQTLEDFCKEAAAKRQLALMENEGKDNANEAKDTEEGEDQSNTINSNSDNNRPSDTLMVDFVNYDDVANSIGAYYKKCINTVVSREIARMNNGSLQMSPAKVATYLKGLIDVAKNDKKSLLKALKDV